MAISRRSFLGTSAAAALATGFSPTTGTAFASESRSPNEKFNLGYIGCGIRFHTALAPFGTEFGPCLALSDVDLVQAGRAQQKIFDCHRNHNQPLDVKIHEDYQHILDNPKIDVVFIGTPDHWHTKPLIEAMKGGKDVYCEKP